MGMPAAFEKWTVELLDALPESSDRFELIDGELHVTPSPSFPHQRAVTELVWLLVGYTRNLGTCETVASPSDVWREPRQENRVQPDVYVVRRHDGILPPYPFHLEELLLAVEVVSLGNPYLDYQVKQRLYAREGVAEYWVVDLSDRKVSRWRGRHSAVEVLADRITWQPDRDVEPLGFDLPEFFDRVLR